MWFVRERGGFADRCGVSCDLSVKRVVLRTGGVILCGLSVKRAILRTGGGGFV